MEANVNKWMTSEIEHLAMMLGAHKNRDILGVIKAGKGKTWADVHEAMTDEQNTRLEAMRYCSETSGGRKDYGLSGWASLRLLEDAYQLALRREREF
jgi:hypothetical protein